MFKALLKKREILKDFRGITKCQKAHLNRLIKRKAEIQSDIFCATKFILEENIDFYKSLIVLIKRGHVQASLLVARTIIENVINLQYIFQKDTEQRAKNYTLCSVPYLLDKLRTLKDGVPGKEETIVRLEKLKGEIDKGGDRDTHWDGKSFKKICEELNQGAIYELWYARLSKFVHSQYTNDRRLEKEGPYTNLLRRFITKDIIVLTLNSLKTINEKYNLLEGFMLIKNYPHENADLIFSISSKEIDEKVAQSK